MMNHQQREFRILGWRVLTRLMKVHGHLLYILEEAQYGRLPDGLDVDALHERMYALHDALNALRRTSIWRSVDVPDDYDVE